jgi:hypothetical protein
MKFPKLKGWFSRMAPEARERIEAERKKSGEELGKQIRAGLIGSILTLSVIVVGLNFPSLYTFFEDIEKRITEPSRTVYIRMEVAEKIKLTPLKGVEVQVVGDSEAYGLTDQYGYLCIPYEAEYDEFEVEITFSKEGYEEEVYFHVAIPEEEGDSTMVRSYQLDPANNSFVRSTSSKYQ